MRYYIEISKFPLINWRDCLGGDKSRTRIDSEKGTADEDESAWEVLHDQYIAKYGVGDDQSKLFELREELAYAQLNYVIDGNTFLLNNINRLESDILEILKRPVEGSMDDCIIYLSKWLGYHFDQEKRTVTQFHDAMGLYKKEAEEMRKLNAKKQA